MPFKNYYIVSFFAITIFLLIFSFRYDYTHYQLKSSFAIEDTKSSKEKIMFIYLENVGVNRRLIGVY